MAAGECPRFQPQLKDPGKWEGEAGSHAARGTETGTQERTRDLWAVGLPGGRRRGERREKRSGEGRRERPSRNCAPSYLSQASPALLHVAQLNMIMLDIQILSISHIKFTFKD